MKNLLFWMFLCGPVLPLTIAAQSGPTTIFNKDSFSLEELQPLTFDPDIWEKAKKGMDFDRIPTESNHQSKKRKSSVFVDPETGLWVIRIVMVFIMLIALFFLVRSWMLIKIPSNRKLSTERSGVALMEHVEIGFMEMDLSALILDAVAAEQYRSAVRLYYLNIIKLLAQRGYIHWKKEKTNFEYSEELRETLFYKEFLELTKIFERVRYGEGLVKRVTFEKTAQRMIEFIRLIPDN
jgi:hypothetical protein